MSSPFTVWPDQNPRTDPVTGLPLPKPRSVSQDKKMSVNVPFQSQSRAQQLSPVSTAGSEWSGMNNYDHQRMDPPYSPSITLNRGEVVTSPDSGSYGGQPNNQINDGYDFPARPMDIPHGRRPSETGSRNSSPAVSIANSRSSDGTISDNQSRKYRRMEYELSQHYTVLRQFLRGAASQGPKQNKAKDKLLRLSPVQFHELSTDVFDELQRRQALNSLSGRPPVRRENVPPFLQPKSTFHEKRNQARQKLSSLQPPRFRDLATDVFLELERRFPQFTDVNRREAPRASSRGPQGQGQNGYPPGAPGPNGFVPPPRNHSHGKSSGSLSQTGQRPPPRNGSSANVPQYDGPPNQSDGDYGRPMPKQFQSNTITPNKSTMVEDDDDRSNGADSRFDRSSDAFGLESAITNHQSNRDTAATSRSGMSSQRDAKLAEMAQAQISELQQRADELEASSRAKDDEIRRLQNKARTNGGSDWSRIKQDLEQKLDQAEHLNQSLRDELDRLHDDQANAERDLRSQLEAAKKGSDGGNAWRIKHEQLEQEHRSMQNQLEQQRQVTEEVRMQATEHLNEMRAMADGGGGNWEREEKLHHDVQRLEEEVKEWKGRYAKTKTALRNVRASSMGLSIARPDASRYAKDSAFRDEQGLVKDVNITKFQISIDELLRIARAGEPSAVLEHMKAVVFAVRNITHDIDAGVPASKDDELAKKRTKLKSKVSATANNVITACKNFASANGISPVSLLDAAASHLTAAVVELVRTVKIRPTLPGELDDDDDGTLEPLQRTGYFNVAESMRRTSAQDSIYSALSAPTETQGQSGPGPSVHSRTASRNVDTPNGANGTSALKPDLGLTQDETELEELRAYLDDQTENLVESIQSLVASIRSEDLMPIIRSHISNIGDVVSNVVSATEGCFEEPSSYSIALRKASMPITNILTDCKKRLLQASVDSQALDGLGRSKEVKDFTARLPPLAFEIARETKELMQRVEGLGAGTGMSNEVEDFS